MNFSIMDGWWCEGYNGSNGWAIGDDTPYDNEHQQDDSDSKFLYEVLERDIIPLFYNRDENGIPVGWAKRIKESIKSLTPIYSTHRMVKEYTEKMYMPSILRNIRIRESHYEPVRALVDWKRRIEKNWDQVAISANQDIHGLIDYNVLSGRELLLSACVQLSALAPEDVTVEVYYGPLAQNAITNGTSMEMKNVRQTDASTFCYEAKISLADGGEYGYSFRVIPRHPNMMNKFDLPLVKWVST